MMRLVNADTCGGLQYKAIYCYILHILLTTHTHHYLSLHRLTRWHMLTDRPSFNYTYTANILPYTHIHMHAHGTCTHLGHALFPRNTHTRTLIHTHAHTHIHAHTHTHIHTHTHTHTLCQSFTINCLDRHTRSSNKGLHKMECL